MPYHWTKEEKELAIKLYKEGNSYEEIANQLENRTVPATRSLLTRLGQVKKAPPRWSKEDDDILKEILETDISYQEMHEHFFPNRSRNAIQQRVDKVFNQKRGMKIYRPHNPIGKNPVGKVPDKPTTVYCVYFPTEDVYKVGATTKSLKERMRHGFPKNFQVILTRYFEDSTEAMELEQAWVKNIYPYKISEKLFKSGNTEIFKFPW